MIWVEFWTSTSAHTDYADILSLEIDKKSCSGVGFTQQEGRMATLSLRLDAWINEHIAEAEMLEGGYLPIWGVVKRDNEILFSGAVKGPAGVKRQSASVDTVDIKLRDLIYVYMDFWSGLTIHVLPEDPFIPKTAVIYAINNVIRPRIPSGIRQFGCQIFDEYDYLEWMPYYIPDNDSILDWTSFPGPEYTNIRLRYFVMYESGGTLYVEYCLYDTLLITAGSPPTVYADYYQHLYWRKWSISGTTVTDIAESGQQFQANNGVLPDYNQATIDAFINAQTKLTDGYPIRVDDDVNYLRINDIGYVISGTEFSLQYHPNMMVHPAEAKDVEVSVLLPDMLKMLCAWIDSDGMNCSLMNRMVLPGSAAYTLPEPYQVERTDGGTDEVSLDCGYLTDGEQIASGVEAYYNQEMSAKLPYSFDFELPPTLDYQIGDVVSWEGYILMITGVNVDLRKTVARVTAMGGAI